MSVLNDNFFRPDVQAARALYSAVCAHDLRGQPVWPMMVAPPGSFKTSLLEPLDGLKDVHLVDKLTSNTLLSGQIVKKRSARMPSLLHRVGDNGILVIPDFSTVLEMKRDDRALILADLRRIYDGQLRKEVGTSEKPLIWKGRITLAVAATPDVDRHYSIFQSLGERFVMIRSHRPGGERRAEEAALKAMSQRPLQVREQLRKSVHKLLQELPPGSPSIAPDFLRKIAALAEFVVRARTHVPRDFAKHLVYLPEAEAPTRLSQQLCQLAKGSARLDRRTAVNQEDFSLVARVGFDCIPHIRYQLLRACIHGDDPYDTLPKATVSYVAEDLNILRLMDKPKCLSAFAIKLLRRAGSLDVPLERV